MKTMKRTTEMKMTGRMTRTWSVSSAASMRRDPVKPSIGKRCQKLVTNIIKANIGGIFAQKSVTYPRQISIEYIAQMIVRKTNQIERWTQSIGPLLDCLSTLLNQSRLGLTFNELSKKFNPLKD